MKMKKILLTVAVIIGSVSMLFAATAKSLYTEFSNAVNENNVSLAIEKYTSLEEKVASEAASANKSIEKALKKNNGTLYRNSASELATLSSYIITKEQSDKLLSAILAESDDKQAEDAAWLYEKSYNYSPVLTLKYSSQSDGFSFNFTSNISQKPGSEVTLPDSSSLQVSTVRVGTLAGWGLTPTSIDYAPGETITMPLTDQTLYAQWENSVSFIDERSATNEVTKDVKEGDVITVPQPVASDNAIFAGWYDSYSGIYLESGTTEYTVKGKGASFTALWENISISSMQSGAYDVNALPTSVQVPLTFTITNSGTETVRDLTIKVTTDNENVTLLNNEAFSRGLRGGSSANMTGVKLVADKALTSGAEIPITVTVTDGNGNTYTSLFKCTIK